jgi:SAM-dependent methyltransferase
VQEGESVSEHNPDGSNAEQIEYWNEVSGPKWVRLGDRVDAQIAPIGREAMDRASVQPGERVLDVGCGCGQTSLELAARVGAGGMVLGLDISGPMLAEAERTREEAGHQHLSFVQADAQTHDLEAEAFDLVFSRFGVMFFDDPVAAFSNLFSALRPGGRLAFVCWQEPGNNPWISVPMMTLASLMPIPLPDSPTAPGPFAFSDPERLVGILEQAGFREARCASLERDVSLGGGLDIEDAVDFVLEMGPAGAAIRDAGEEAAKAARDAVLEALRPHVSEGGSVVLGAASWLATAVKGSASA